MKHRFDREVKARRAEREHTLSLTKAQQYVLRELRLLNDQVREENLHRQIAVIEAAFRQPNPRPAVRNELNRLRREALSGEGMLRVLTRIYHLYGLDEPRQQQQVSEDENEGLTRIVCSEALMSQ